MQSSSIPSRGASCEGIIVSIDIAQGDYLCSHTVVESLGDGRAAGPGGAGDGSAKKEYWGRGYRLGVSKRGIDIGMMTGRYGCGMNLSSKPPTVK